MPAMMKLFAVMIMLLGAKTDSVLTEKGKTMSDYICDNCIFDNCDECPLWWEYDPTNDEGVMLDE